jgi:tetratricopeptide (TPR) repeat protein
LSAGTTFHALLAHAVRRHTERTGAKKRAIAAACGYSPGMLSHMVSGKRRPGSRQAVLALARALELSRAETNRHLAALDYSALTDAEVGATMIETRMAEASAEGLPQPERDLLTTAIYGDLKILSAAWQHYIDLRDELHRRNWAEVAGRWDAAMSYYRELLAAAPRFMAWLELGRAEASQYQGQMDEAKAAARRGLAAAEVSGNRAVQALLTVKLADAEKVQGYFADADAHYHEADRVLQRWNPAAETERRFVEHWRARIQRERGNLFLFMGLGAEADALLRESYEYFSGAGHRYEEARVCHSLAWAAHLIGDWDGSLTWRERAIALGRELYVERGWDDPLSAMQDRLYLGLLLEDRGDYVGAEAQLNHALATPTLDQPSFEYHELGLAYLSLSRIYRAPWEKRDLALAEWWGRRGLDFYDRMPTKDPVRVAIAHNAYGDLLLDLDRVHEAKLEFEQALVWAQSSDPPSRYYEAAARVRRCRVLLAEEKSRRRRAPEPMQLALDLAAIEGGQTDPTDSSGAVADLDGAPGPLDRIEEEMAAADAACRESGYWQLLAQLKLVEASLRSDQDDGARAEEACWQALWAALHLNRFVLSQTWKGVQILANAATQPTIRLEDLRRRTMAALEEIGPAAPDRSLVEAARELLNNS